MNQDKFESDKHNGKSKNTIYTYKGEDREKLPPLDPIKDRSKIQKEKGDDFPNEPST